MTHQAWAEVDLGRLAHNLREVRRRVGPRAGIIAVVKANAYGHGAVRVARELEGLGVGMFGVATPAEAAELREGGVRGSILILGCAFPSEAEVILRSKAAITISDIALARAFSEAAEFKGVRIPVHLKVDTGMGRLGVPSREAVESALRLAGMPGLKLEGILTHFPSAEEDAPFTEGQIDLFDRICSEIRGSGVEIPLRHAANSAAVLAHPRSHFDAVRPGICLYGCGGRSGPDFQPVLSLKSRVGLLKRFSAGDTIGYGRTYRAERAMLAALVPIGYADGLSRMLSNPPAGRAGRGAMLVRGWRAPIVGRVSMGHTMIDATEVSRACGIEVGDEVVVYGEQGRERISVEDVAEGLGTISYEVLCAIGSRVPRVYVAGRSDE